MTLNHPEDYYIKILYEKAKIKEIMKTDIITAHIDENLSSVEQKFVSNGLSHIPIVDYKEKLVGLISMKYLYKACAPKRPISPDEVNNLKHIIDGDAVYDKAALDAYILGHIMLHNPFALKPDDTLAEAMINMKKRKISYIPIVNEEHKVCGSLSNMEIVDFTVDILVQ